MWRGPAGRARGSVGRLAGRQERPGREAVWAAHGPQARRPGAAAMRSGLAGGDRAGSPIRAQSRASVREESAAAVRPRRSLMDRTVLSSGLRVAAPKGWALEIRECV
ncbi:hypothetical protein NDU88_002965 [Pleurodeles waltl]|uniref:Uncharacterized protein n=1 Tax=Pleurodeles waltl TaxID=8319 RepID=A0AAV7NGT1_PLEWA|nr:hypothetical protein NDU88_002965 [Pleurodeles waltl]